MREGNAGVSSSETHCTTAGGSYLSSPRRGSGVGLVWWTSEARDSVRRRLSLSRLGVISARIKFFILGYG